MVAELRHPLCVRPHAETATAMSLLDRQAARIVDLEGKLEAAAGREHKANNRLQVADGVLEMLASLLGLNPGATPPQILAEAMRRLK